MASYHLHRYREDGRARKSDPTTVTEDRRCILCRGAHLGDRGSLPKLSAVANTK